VGCIIITLSELRLQSDQPLRFNAQLLEQALLLCEDLLLLLPLPDKAFL